MSKSESKNQRGRELNIIKIPDAISIGEDFETEKTKHLSNVELQRLVMLHQLKNFEAKNVQFSTCNESECDTEETKHLSEDDGDSEEYLSIRDSKREEKAKKMQSKLMEFKQIMNDKCKKRKTNPECETFDDATYYKALYKISKTEIDKLKEENVKLKKKLEEKEKVEELIKTYQSLNRRLQKQLLKIIESNKNCDAVDATPTKFTFSKFGETSTSPDISENVSSNSLDSNINDHPSSIKSPENEWQNLLQDEEVKTETESRTFFTIENVGQTKEGAYSKNGAEREVYLSEQQLDYIDQYKGDSQYIKAMAVGVWGSEVLSASSISGMVPNRYKHYKARKPLSPKKLQFIKDTFRARMIKENCSKTEIELRLKSVNRYISEKISDLRRKVNSER